MVPKLRHQTSLTLRCFFPLSRNVLTTFLLCHSMYNFGGGGGWCSIFLRRAVYLSTFRYLLTLLILSYSTTPSRLTMFWKQFDTWLTLDRIEHLFQSYESFYLLGKLFLFLSLSLFKCCYHNSLRTIWVASKGKCCWWNVMKKLTRTACASLSSWLFLDLWLSFSLDTECCRSRTMGHIATGGNMWTRFTPRLHSGLTWLAHLKM